MNRNKSPGIDGFTLEFCITFWYKLKHNYVTESNYFHSRGATSI